MVKPLIKENVIERELLTRVKGAGGIAEKVTTLGARGFFDRLVVLPEGRIIFVEVKKPKGSKIPSHQILRHDVYRSLGAEVRIIKTSDDIDRLLAGG